MNQTNGGSEKDSNRVQVVVDIFEHDPENQKGGYKILTGKNIPGIGEIGIEPGMTITVKDGIEVDAEKKKEILDKQKTRKTARQVGKQKELN